MNPFLLPPTLLYEACVRLRTDLYACGVIKSRRLRRPVISVGNLTMGGTGKTPTVIALSQMLCQAGNRVSILLRGYRGQNKRGPLLVSDGKQIRTDSLMAGDEAMVLARNLPGALVAVGTDRAESGNWVESHFDVDVHLLDDGFQHLRVQRDLNLLLLDATDPFGRGYVPPLGRLREPLTGMRRADAILLTRVQVGQTQDSLRGQLNQFIPATPVFLVRQKLVSASLFGSTEIFDLGEINTHLLAFAGIGNPGQFFGSLRIAGLKLAGELCFPDHHRYSRTDMQRLERECQRLGLNTVITTEKDSENGDFLKLTPLRVIVVKVAFEFDDPDGVRSLVLGALKRN